MGILDIFRMKQAPRRPIAGTQPTQEAEMQRNLGRSPTGMTPVQKRKSRPPGPRSRKVASRRQTPARTRPTSRGKSVRATPSRKG